MADKSHPPNPAALSADIADFIGWDVKNWGKAIGYWQRLARVDRGDLECLELGAHRGGLSLWLAQCGNRVICSDLSNPRPTALPLHQKYGCESAITYRAVNVLDIGMPERFDVIIFKSILGGVARNGRNEWKKKAIDEIHRSLKPGGKLLFAENLEGTTLHKWARTNFTTWGRSWNYLKYDEIPYTFASFDRIQFKTTGFFGAFGPTEPLRNALGSLDNVVSPLIPSSRRYIVMGVAEK